MSEPLSEEFLTFSGVEEAGDGTLHTVTRVTCVKCGAAVSEFHYDCCGYCGRRQMRPHRCGQKWCCPRCAVDVEQEGFCVLCKTLIMLQEPPA